VQPEDELPDGEGTYRFIVVMAMHDDLYHDPSLNEEAVGIAGALQEAFAKCEGVEVLEVRVASEADLSLQDIRELIRWDYQDHLSERQGRSEEISPLS
jgi:hypothetical protein